jgi:hypothetical protein
MRKFIDTVALLESVTFHPAVMTIENGQKYVGWPDGTTEQVETTCLGCEGDGKCPYGSHEPCDDCGGTGKWKETKYNLPEFRASNEGLQTVLDILGMEFDYAGWIAPEQLPLLRRQLIRMLNGDTSGYEQEPEKHQRVSVDRSGDIPAITRGPTMYKPGITNSMLEGMIRRMLEIIDYCQKGGYGLSWG